MTASSRFASPIDASAFGEHRPPTPARRRLATRFSGRIGDAGHPAAAGRYHLYAGLFCPRSHRATIALALAGLGDVVSVSFVDGLRDGRGWAFRERTGPDPVNGYTLLSEAYRASEPGFTGLATVPVLWDRGADRIVNSDPDAIDVDLASAFGEVVAPAVELYPAARREEIDAMSRRIAALGQTITRAVYLDAAKAELRDALRGFDRIVAGRRHLLGNDLTLADIRLWVLLVRYDAGPNATGAAGPGLAELPDLWAYARRLYALPAFSDTTDFGAFTAPLTRLPDWAAGGPTAVPAPSAGGSS